MKTRSYFPNLSKLAPAGIRWRPCFHKLKNTVYKMNWFYWVRALSPYFLFTAWGYAACQVSRKYGNIYSLWREGSSRNLITLLVDNIFIKSNLKISNNLNQSLNTNVDIIIQLLMKFLIQWKLRTLVEAEQNDRQRDPSELKFSITKVLMILSQVKKD